MSRPRSVPFTFLLAFTLTLTHLAHADANSTGIAADRFSPGIGPLTLFGGEAAEVTPFAQLSWVVSLSLQRDPLKLSTQLGGEVIARPVHDQLVSDVGLEAGFWNRFAIGLGVPAVLYADGDRLRGTSADDAPLATTAGGDLRMRLKAAFIGDPARQGMHVAVLVQVTVPLGGQSQFAATDGVTFEPRLLADFRYGRFLFCAALGVRFAPERTLFETTFGDELTWLGGASLALVERGRFSGGLVAEFAGAVGPSDGTRPAEFRGGLRAALGALAVDVGAGAGLVGDAGAPSWRLFAVLRHSFHLY